jgi:oxygen-independent coproporphyrinogen-3 oxidase
VKHPTAYAARLAAGASPAQAREVLTAEQQHEERVLLAVRLREGLPAAELDPSGLAGARRAAADGLLEPSALDRGSAVLTLRGRLLADAVVRQLL